MWDLGRDMGLVFVIFCIFVRKDGGFRLHAYAARHTFWGAALIEAPMELLTLDQVKRKELEILKYVVALTLTPILRMRCYCSDCQGGRIF